MIDLRSDTATRPTPAMRRAMLDAPVGDDVLAADPTVQRFQATIAERTGKEAALFFPSGTQSNLAALLAHCQRGDEYLVGQRSHTYRYEGGGAAVFGSIQPQPVDHAPDGSLPLDKLAAAVKPAGDPHYARTRLLALENTFHGQVIAQDYLRAAADFARAHGLAVHLDGARVFNAAVASGVAVDSLCAPFDTVSICFSKGLGAPVGSVLVGERERIAAAHRWRKVLGGGMRQAGVLAGACLYALDHHVERLSEDHAHAERLAQGLADIDGVRGVTQHTNMVFVDLAPSVATLLTEALRERGIFISTPYAGPVRLVTHLDVSRADVDAVVVAVKNALSRQCSHEILSHITKHRILTAATKDATFLA